MIRRIYNLTLELVVIYFLGAWLLNWPLPEFSLCCPHHLLPQREFARLHFVTRKEPKSFLRNAKVPSGSSSPVVAPAP